MLVWCSLCMLCMLELVLLCGLVWRLCVYVFKEVGLLVLELVLCEVLVLCGFALALSPRDR